MNKFRALLWLSLKAMLSSVSGGRSRKRAAAGWGAMALMAGIALYVSAVYSFLFAAQLAPVGRLELLIALMSALAAVFGLMFTLFAAQGVVFGGKDNDLMLSLPIPAFTLMLARTSALYVENLIFSLFTMLPAGAAYLWFGGGGGAAFLPVLLLGTLFLALLPTLFSLVIGFALAWLSGKFARRALFSSLLYFAVFFLMLAGIFQLNGMMTDLSARAEGISGALSVWGLPFSLLGQAACRGDASSLLALAVLCSAPFLLAVRLFAGRYREIITALGVHSARSDYRLGVLSVAGCRRALLRKEARRFFGTPIYLFNSGMGLILMLLTGFAPFLFRGRLAELLLQLESAGVQVLPLIAAVTGVLLSTVIITAPSIGLEGRQLWILKEAPVSPADIFMVKTDFQLLLTAPNDMVVVKQSASVVASLFAGLLLTAAGGLLYAAFFKALGSTAALLPPLALYLAGSGALCWVLAVRGVKRFLDL